MLKKAGEFSGVRNDFECIVRIALRMGYDVRKLVPVWRRRHARRHGAERAGRSRARRIAMRCGLPSAISNRR